MYSPSSTAKDIDKRPHLAQPCTQPPLQGDLVDGADGHHQTRHQQVGDRQGEYQIIADCLQITLGLDGVDYEQVACSQDTNEKDRKGDCNGESCLPSTVSRMRHTMASEMTPSRNRLLVNGLTKPSSAASPAAAPSTPVMLPLCVAVRCSTDSSCIMRSSGSL